MGDDVTQAKQEVLIGQYQTLYDDYMANLSAARFQKAGESQQALGALEDDIYENTLSMPASANSGYLDLKRKMERVPTAQAQQDHTQAQMDASKLRYYALLVVAALAALAALRLLVLSSTPSKIEGGLFLVASGLMLFFLFRY